jgi:hypothetical protein
MKKLLVFEDGLWIKIVLDDEGVVVVVMAAVAVVAAQV